MLKRLYEATLGSFRARVQILLVIIWCVVFSLVIVPFCYSGGIKGYVVYGGLLAGLLYYIYCYVTKRGEIIVGFIESIALSLVVYLFVSARVGLFIIITLFVVLGLSVINAAVAACYTSVDMTVDKTLVNKGEPFTVNIKVTNHSILPTTPLVFRLKWSMHLKCEEGDTYTVFVMPRDTQELNVELCGKICGQASVSIDRVEVKNHFGACVFKKLFTDELCEKIALVPEVHGTTERTEIVQAVINSANTSDDGEDTVEGVGNVFSGFPGYENREYVPGDPLKRINWKQSAKRGRLLVRKEDEAELSSVYVWLDRCFSLLSDTEEALLCTQSCIEGSLALALSLVKSGCHVIYVSYQDGWVTSELNTEAKLNELTRRLAYYRFEKSVDTADRFPPKSINGKEAKNILLCTPFADNVPNTVTNGADISVYSVVEYDSDVYNSLTALAGEGDADEQNK